MHILISCMPPQLPAPGTTCYWITTFCLYRNCRNPVYNATTHGPVCMWTGHVPLESYLLQRRWRFPPLNTLLREQLVMPSSCRNANGDPNLIVKYKTHHKITFPWNEWPLIFVFMLVIVAFSPFLGNVYKPFCRDRFTFHVQLLCIRNVNKSPRPWFEW